MFNHYYSYQSYIAVFRSSLSHQHYEARMHRSQCRFCADPMFNPCRRDRSFSQCGYWRCGANSRVDLSGVRGWLKALVFATSRGTIFVHVATTSIDCNNSTFWLMDVASLEAELWKWNRDPNFGKQMNSHHESFDCLSLKQTATEHLTVSVDKGHQGPHLRKMKEGQEVRMILEKGLRLCNLTELVECTQKSIHDFQIPD